MDKQTADKIIEWMTENVQFSTPSGYLADYVPDYVKDFLNSLVSEDVTTINPTRLVTFGDGGVDLQLETDNEIALSEVNKFIAEFPANKNLSVKFYSAYLAELTQQKED